MKKQHHISKEPLEERKKFSLNLMFNFFAKKVSDLVGSALTFILAFLVIIIWIFSGPHFHYSDTWQLVINTGTSVITFLVVFLIQNTQNRDTEILKLQLDELIKSKKGARNTFLSLEELTDEELKTLEKEYLKIKNKKTGD